MNNQGVNLAIVLKRKVPFIQRISQWPPFKIRKFDLYLIFITAVDFSESTDAGLYRLRLRLDRRQFLPHRLLLKELRMPVPGISTPWRTVKSMLQTSKIRSFLTKPIVPLVLVLIGLAWLAFALVASPEHPIHEFLFGYEEEGFVYYPISHRNYFFLILDRW